MIICVIYLIIGTVLLYFGANWMVKSSVHIASKLNISRFVIGLTIVAFGTSLPELGVSLKAALYDKSGIAIGNIIGSNITNILLVLGICSLVSPIVILFSEIKKDIFKNDLATHGNFLQQYIFYDLRISTCKGNIKIFRMK